MDYTKERGLMLVVICTPQPCIKCEEQLPLGTYCFWRKLEKGGSEAWHIECDEQYIEREAQERREHAIHES